MPSHLKQIQTELVCIKVQTTETTPPPLNVGPALTWWRPISRDGSYIKIRSKSDPIQCNIIRFESETEKFESESDKNNPNPSRIRIGFGGRVKFNPTFNLI